MAREHYPGYEPPALEWVDREDRFSTPVGKVRTIPLDTASEAPQSTKEYAGNGREIGSVMPNPPASWPRPKPKEPPVSKDIHKIPTHNGRGRKK